MVHFRGIYPWSNKNISEPKNLIETSSEFQRDVTPLSFRHVSRMKLDMACFLSLFFHMAGDRSAKVWDSWKGFISLDRDLSYHLRWKSSLERAARACRPLWKPKVPVNRLGSKGGYAVSFHKLQNVSSACESQTSLQQAARKTMREPACWTSLLFCAGKNQGIPAWWLVLMFLHLFSSN